MGQTFAKFRLLGKPLLAAEDGQSIDLPTIKTIATLSMILDSGLAGINRATVGGVLWSLSTEAQARTNLRQALSAIRKAMGPLASNLANQSDTLTFSRSGVNLDIDLLAKSPSAFSDADLTVLLDAEEFLNGMSMNEELFEEWLADRRSHYRRKLQDVLEREGRLRIDLYDFAAAERIATKLIALDNFNEAAHRLRMLALEGCGEVATALRHFESMKVLLRSELGVAPGAETSDLAMRLRSRAAGDARPLHTPVVETTTVTLASPEPRRKDEASPDLRNVAVIAVDIRVSMHDAAANLEAVAACADALSSLARTFGATELTNTGQSFLAVFGYPLAHSKDGERSVAFAQALMPAISGIVPAAAVRSAIVSGVVFANVSQNRSVLGDPVRMAQTLLHQTPDNAIRVDKGIFQATRQHVTFVPVGRNCWQVAAPSGESAPNLSSELVGRERETGQVVDILKDAMVNLRGEVVLLRGAAGIGKTRMCHEIARAADQLGFRSEYRRVLDFGQGRDENSLSMIARAISTEQPAGLNGLEIALWRTLVPGEADDFDRRMIGELDRRTLLLEQSKLLCKLAERRAVEKPFVLIVEDIHWAEASLIAALAELANAIDSMAFVLVATTRPENDPVDMNWKLKAGQTRVTKIDIPALRQDAALQLARNVRSLDGPILQLCIERAAGNPLFIEQLVLWAEEQSDSNLPLSVQSVVQERLDKLDAETRRLAQSASVLGQVFQAEALAAVYGDRIDGELGLAKAHLVVRRGDKLTFVHALVRDGIYASLSPRHREQLHLRAAEWFAARDPVLSARHSFWSGRQEASAICHAAAVDEHRAGRLDTAKELAELAIARCQDATEISGQQLLLGEILRDMEQFRDAIAAFRQAESPNDVQTLKARTGAAESYFRLDEHGEAVRFLDEAETLELSRADPKWKTTIACLRSGIEFARSNSELSYKYALAAVQSAKEISEPRLKARVVGSRPINRLEEVLSA